MSLKASSSNPTNIEIFYGSQDFVLWQKKMLSLFVHHGIKGAMDNDYLTNISDIDKAKMEKHAYHTNLFHLSDDILTTMRY